MCYCFFCSASLITESSLISCTQFDSSDIPSTEFSILVLHCISWLSHPQYWVLYNASWTCWLWATLPAPPVFSVWDTNSIVKSREHCLNTGGYRWIKGMLLSCFVNKETDFWHQAFEISFVIFCWTAHRDRFVPMKGKGISSLVCSLIRIVLRKAHCCNRQVLDIILLQL